MPRNNQGLYTLPSGNPVYPGTLIEADWANSTLTDVADALTLSLPRDGSAPMTGPLTLVNGDPTQARHATPKSYVDRFVAYSTGLPVGAVVAVAGAIVPAGFAVCDGGTLSRADYPELFATIGTIYGAGDGVSTFNVPDLRGYFIRGKADATALGTVQAGTFAAHNHSVADPGHTHGVTDPVHRHYVPHTHYITDPGHAHIVEQRATPTGSLFQYPAPSQYLTDASVSSRVAYTGITIQSSNPLSDGAATGVTVKTAVTGVSTGDTGGAETVPQNVSMLFYIKTTTDSSGTIAVQTITSDDPAVISIDDTLAYAPELAIHSNVPYGLAKLDGEGKIPLALNSASYNVYLGLFDASSGLNPSEAFPGVSFASGSVYDVAVGGTIPLYDSGTLTPGPVAVQVGWKLTYVDNSATSPTGWYYLVPSFAAVNASDVGYIPTGEVQATNVQAAITELDTEKAVAALVVPRTAATGAAAIPAGTTAQRPATGLAAGMLRWNSDAAAFEKWDGSSWTALVSTQRTGFKNYLINGDFTVNQRPAFGAPASNYMVDRWTQIPTNNGFSWSVIPVRSQPGLGVYTPSQHAISISEDVVDNGIMAQYVEGVTQFGGKKFTLAILHSKPAGMTINDPNMVLSMGTGGSANVLGIVLSHEEIAVGPYFLQKWVIEFPDLSGSTVGTTEPYTDMLQVRPRFAGTYTGALFLRCQLEEGEEFTGFEYRPLWLETQLCQRYFQKHLFVSLQAAAVSGQKISLGHPFFMPMRKTPSGTYTTVAGTNVVVTYAATSLTVAATPSATGAVTLSNVYLDAEL